MEKIKGLKEMKSEIDEQSVSALRREIHEKEGRGAGMGYKKKFQGWYSDPGPPTASSLGLEDPICSFYFLSLFNHFGFCFMDKVWKYRELI